jgi:predicted RNA binding protein YcfA (HicA-like mRNA interferase family)
MGSIPVLKAKEVAAILELLGFNEIRQKGSHKQFRHPDGRVTQQVKRTGAYGGFTL